jgi:Ribonuclease G/E
VGKEDKWLKHVRWPACRECKGTGIVYRTEGGGAHTHDRAKRQKDTFPEVCEYCKEARDRAIKLAQRNAREDPS